MKINPNYKIREIAGENIVVNQGSINVDTTRIISLNDSARLLYQTLAEQDFTIEDAANVLVETYGIAEKQAIMDAEKWAEALKQCGIITE